MAAKAGGSCLIFMRLCRNPHAAPQPPLGADLGLLRRSLAWPSKYALRYCDCGTWGPPGAGLGAAGAPGMPFCNWLSRPPPWLSGGAGGTPAGVSWLDGAPPVLMIEAGLRSKLASHDSVRLVTKNAAASAAVVRDKTLAVPRPVMNPLLFELTSPPPSDFCNSTTPIMATTSMR